ncbi:MAG: DUF4143 domain-containing protein, partial [Bacteroidota bacterium]
LRNDTGALWENYCISERIKLLSYLKSSAQSYFWRTTQQQEIDYIEEMKGMVAAFEFKYNPLKRARFSKTFLESYNTESTKVITPGNIEEFLL